MQPNLSDILLEWTFSPQEAHIAQQLDEIKLRWIATKYAKLFKEKATLEMPITPDESKQYFLKLARIDGRLDSPAWAATNVSLIYGPQSRVVPPQRNISSSAPGADFRDRLAFILCVDPNSGSRQQGS